MKLGMGLYHHQLNDDHDRFALQGGPTHLVVHIVGCFRSSRSNWPDDQQVGDDCGWGLAGDSDALWTYEQLAAPCADSARHGLKIEAVENFDPAHLYDVLLDGPKQMRRWKQLKTMVRNVGRAGFRSLDITSHRRGRRTHQRAMGRWGAELVAMENSYEKSMPHGMVWNMVYDGNAPAGTLAPIAQEDLWQRHGEFLDALVPVGEQFEVIVEAHPDDPPCRLFGSGLAWCFSPICIGACSIVGQIARIAWNSALVRRQR